MTDRWRYACPECGSRQVFKRGHGYTCHYAACDAGQVDPVDLKRTA